MSRRKLVGSVSVNDYTTIHPVLDFFDGKAIVAVGGKWQHNYDDGEVDFATSPLCVLSTGEKFEYSKKELAERKLFHTGYIDVQPGRWNFENVNEWCEDKQSLDIQELFLRVQDKIKYYMDFSDKRLYALLPCFIIYTYFYPLFSTAPVIQFWGEFRTGKTKILSLLEAMALNPINSANISSASVFRLVESRRAVILLDESEDLTGTDKGKEIRNMLLAGTGKSGETFRQEKSMDDSFHTQSFKVFSPKVIANIAGIDTPALQSRTIRITTIGAADKAMENREVEQSDPRWLEMRNELYRFCLCHFQDVIEKRDTLPEHGMSGRSLGIWKGIFTIASLVGKVTWDKILAYAKENKEIIDAEAEEAEWHPRQLISDLLDMVEKHPGKELYAPEEISLYLGQSLEYTSRRELGVAMGRLGFFSRPTSRNSEKGRFYNIPKEKLLMLQKRR